VILRNSRLPLGLVLGLNSALRQNSVFAGITVLSIAASVALATSLELSSRAVQELADRTAEALAGKAQLELVAGTLGIPERWVDEVRRVPGVSSASPMLLATFGVDAAKLPIHVLGVDFLEPGESGRADLRSRGVEVPDTLKLLARADAIVIAERVAARTGVDFDGTLDVTTPRGTRALHVEGMLADRGVSRAFGGQVAVMDLYALQALLGREGSVDRIDVVPVPGADLAELQGRIEAQVRGAATVQRSGARLSSLDQSIAALRAALLLVGAIGSLVAGLLSYAAMSTAVERRLPELAVLRSTGFSARDVARFIAVDAVVVSACGTALGFAAGRVLAELFLPTLSRVSEYYVAGSTQESDVAISLWTVGLALGTGIVSALCGAIGPARTATRRWVLDGGSDLPGEGAAPGARRPLWLGFAALLALVSLAPGLPSRARLLAMLLLGTALAACLVTPALALVGRRREQLSRWLPGVGHLLGTGLAVRTRGTGLAVAAIACLVGFVSGAIILAGSFGETLLGIARARYPDAVWVSARAVFDETSTAVVLPDVVETVRRAPGVTAACEQYGSTILVRGEEVTLAALDTRTSLAHRDPDERARIEATYSRLAFGEIAVSGAFARRFGLHAGDTLELPTPAGPHLFHISGELFGMAGPGGIVFMDLTTFDQFWKRPGADGVLVWTQGDPTQVIDALRALTWRRQSLFFTENAELLERATAFAQRFDALLFGVATLALVLGGVAIANLLLGIVAARQRELELLRTAGAAPNQLAGVVWGDAALIAAGALCAGFALGGLIARPMLEIMGEEFGLLVEMHVDGVRLSLLAALVGASVFASATYPALLARRAPVTSAFS
jgi:putative ABC transport system permease protein